MMQPTINVLELQVDAIVRNAVTEHEKHKGTHGQRFSAEQKRAILDKAEALGGQGAAADWWNGSSTQKVSQSSISRWATTATLENKKPGTKSMLSADDLAEIFGAFDRLRDRAIKVDCSLFARAARGIMRRLHPEMFRLGDKRGYRVFSSSWARQVMLKNGLRPARATTNRTVSAADIVTEGKLFYAKLHRLKPHPDLTLNADEFFVLLSGDSKRWTWYRKCTTGPQNIAIREDRVGFTACAVTTATGALVCLQLVWKGKTKASEARMQPHELNDTIFQCHNGNTHFQNEASWNCVLQKIKTYVAAARKSKGLSNEVRGAFLYDHAPQHGTEANVQIALADVAVDAILVPKKMTHCFQPCDMYVIACIKSATDAAWKVWIESCFANNTVEDAVKLVESAGSATVKKQKKYEFLSAAIKHIQRTDAIVASWEASGVAREIGLPPRLGLSGLPRTQVVFDTYVELAKIVQNVDEEEPVDDGNDYVSGGDDGVDDERIILPPRVQPEAQRPRAPQPPPAKKKPGRPPLQHATQKGPNLHELFAREKKHRTENPVVVEIPPPQVNEDEAQLVESSSDESV